MLNVINEYELSHINKLRQGHKTAGVLMKNVTDSVLSISSFLERMQVFGLILVDQIQIFTWFDNLGSV